MTAADESRVVWRHEPDKDGPSEDWHNGYAAPPAEGLTADELLDEWVRTNDFPHIAGGWTVPRLIDRLRAEARAEVAATPPAEGLDVNALRATLRVWFGGGDFGISDIPDEIAEKYAEYAALAPEQPE